MAEKIKEAKQVVEQTLENTEDAVVDMQQQAEKYYSDNKTTINSILFGLVIVIGGYLAYKNLYYKPLVKEAQAESFIAESYFEKDSFALALNGGAQFKGFIEIIDEYSATPMGNLANYYAGICALRTGDFAGAIDYLNDFSTDDVNLKAVSLGATGDAYAEQEDLDSAIDFYQKAADVPNEFTAPIYLMKAAQLLEKQADFSSALELYKTIKSDYPSAEEARMIDKYMQRASLLANK